VTVDYRSHLGQVHRAINDVTFDIRKGEILGVVGESGSGKTTLGKVVAGFVVPSRGTLRVRDDYSGELAQRASERGHGFRDIQMIFQESAMALDPRKPVWRSIAEAVVAADRPASSAVPGTRRKHSRVKQEAIEQIRRVGLPTELANKRPAEMSGGEKQRIAIARALSAQPAIIVCDEAVASIDVSRRAIVLNLLAKLRADTGIALLFISHDISVVAHLADRVLVMSEGSVVESGSAREIIDHPKDPYTRHLINSVPTLERIGHWSNKD
jgi:ABC-type glutathione transport system ATPase component